MSLIWWVFDTFVPSTKTWHGGSSGPALVIMVLLIPAVEVTNLVRGKLTSSKPYFAAIFGCFLWFGLAYDNLWFTLIVLTSIGMGMDMMVTIGIPGMHYAILRNNELVSLRSDWKSYFENPNLYPLFLEILDQAQEQGTTVKMILREYDSLPAAEQVGIQAWFRKRQESPRVTDIDPPELEEYSD